MSLKDILNLMAGMRKHGIAALEVPGLKLALGPTVVHTGPAPATAGGIVGNTVIGPSVERAFSAIEQSRIEAAVQRRAKLQAMKDKAAGGIGMNTSTLTDNIYKSTLLTKPPAK